MTSHGACTKGTSPSSHSSIVAPVEVGGSYSSSSHLWSVVCDEVSNAQIMATDTTTQTNAHGVGIDISAAVPWWRRRVSRTGSSQVMKRGLHTLPQKPSSNQMHWRHNWSPCKTKFKQTMRGKWCAEIVGVHGRIYIIEYYDGHVITGDERGPNFPAFVLRLRKKKLKQEIDPTGDRTRARCVRSNEVIPRQL